MIESGPARGARREGGAEKLNSTMNALIKSFEKNSITPEQELELIFELTAFLKQRFEKHDENYRKALFDASVARFQVQTYEEYATLNERQKSKQSFHDFIKEKIDALYPADRKRTADEQKFVDSALTNIDRETTMEAEDYWGRREYESSRPFVEGVKSLEDKTRKTVDAKKDDQENVSYLISLVERIINRMKTRLDRQIIQ